MTEAPKAEPVTAELPLWKLSPEQLDEFAIIVQHFRDERAADEPELAEVWAALVSAVVEERGRRDEEGVDLGETSPDWTPEIDPETGEPPEGDG